MVKGSHIQEKDKHSYYHLHKHDWNECVAFSPANMDNFNMELQHSVVMVVHRFLGSSPR